MTIVKIMALARKNLSNESSRLCMEDAVNLYDAGDYEHARSRALASMLHSVGVFSPDYRAAARD